MTNNNISTCVDGERFDFRVVEQLTRCSISELAQQVGVPVTRVRHWHRTGHVGWDTADEIAIRLGYHPAVLWPNWINTEPAAR